MVRVLYTSSPFKHCVMSADYNTLCHQVWPCVSLIVLDSLDSRPCCDCTVPVNFIFVSSLCASCECLVAISVNQIVNGIVDYNDKMTPIGFHTNYTHSFKCQFPCKHLSEGCFLDFYSPFNLIILAGHEKKLINRYQEMCGSWTSDILDSRMDSIFHRQKVTDADPNPW